MDQNAGTAKALRTESARNGEGNSLHIAGVGCSSHPPPTEGSQILTRHEAAENTVPIVPVEPGRIYGPYLGTHRGRSAFILTIGDKRFRFVSYIDPEDVDERAQELRAAVPHYSHSPIVNGPVHALLRNRLRTTISRAKTRNIPLSITIDDLVGLYHLQGGLCAVSGLPMDVSDVNAASGRDRGPLRPSIDRIRSRGGYTPGNVRLVCAAVNYAMGPWGEALFRFIASATAGGLGQGQKQNGFAARTGDDK